MPVSTGLAMLHPQALRASSPLLTLPSASVLQSHLQPLFLTPPTHPEWTAPSTSSKPPAPSPQLPHSHPVCLPWRFSKTLPRLPLAGKSPQQAKVVPLQIHGPGCPQNSLATLTGSSRKRSLPICARLFHTFLHPLALPAAPSVCPGQSITSAPRHTHVLCGGHLTSPPSTFLCSSGVPTWGLRITCHPIPPLQDRSSPPPPAHGAGLFE